MKALPGCSGRVRLPARRRKRGSKHAGKKEGRICEGSGPGVRCRWRRDPASDVKAVGRKCIAGVDGTLLRPPASSSASKHGRDQLCSYHRRRRNRRQLFLCLKKIDKQAASLKQCGQGCVVDELITTLDTFPLLRGSSTRVVPWQHASADRRHVREERPRAEHGRGREWEWELGQRDAPPAHPARDHDHEHPAQHAARSHAANNAHDERYP